MGYYKIKNLTSFLGKRDANSNSVQTIDIPGKFSTESITIAPNQEFLLEANFLPVNLQMLRTSGVISINEIAKDEYVSAVAENMKKFDEDQLSENKAVEDNTDKKSAIVKKK